MQTLFTSDEDNKVPGSFLDSRFFDDDQPWKRFLNAAVACTYVTIAVAAAQVGGLVIDYLIAKKGVQVFKHTPANLGYEVLGLAMVGFAGMACYRNIKSLSDYLDIVKVGKEFYDGKIDLTTPALNRFESIKKVRKKKNIIQKSMT